MAKTQNIDERRPDLSHVKGHATRAQLRPLPPGTLAERRNLSSRRALLRRVYGEFLEMPELTLSLAQAARLFSLPSSICVRVLSELIEGDVLSVTSQGRYALLNRGR
jgi:hypothetical protein